MMNNQQVRTIRFLHKVENNSPLRRDEGILYNSSYWQPNSRYMKASILLLFLSIHFQAQAKDYAVIVTGTDTYGLQVNLKNNSNRTAALYKEKGYEVIVIDINEGKTKNDFLKSLNNLKDVNSLVININSHGTARSATDMSLQGDLTAEEVGKFPITYLRPDEVDNHGGLEIRDGKPYNMTQDIRFAYALDVHDGKQKLGLQELYNSLYKLKSENPSMVTTLFSQACYGGNAAKGFDLFPDMQIFAATTSEKSAMAYDKDVSKTKETSNRDDVVSYVDFFQDNLFKNESYIEAHIDAKKVDLTNKQIFISTAQYPDIDMLTIPQSNIELYFSDMCLGPPKKSELIECNQSIRGKNSLDELSLNVGKIQIQSVMDRLISLEENFTDHMSKGLDCNFTEPPIAITTIKSARDEIVNRYKQMLEPQFIQDQLGLIEAIKNAKTSSELKTLAPTYYSTYFASSSAPEIIIMFKNQYIKDYINRLESLKNSQIIKAIKEHVKELESQRFSECELKVCDYDKIRNSWVLREVGVLFKTKISLPIPSYLNHSSSNNERFSYFNQEFETQCKGKKTSRECFKTIKDNDILRMFTLESSLFKWNNKEHEQMCGKIKRLQIKNASLRKCLNSLSKNNSQTLSKLIDLIKIGTNKP